LSDFTVKLLFRFLETFFVTILIFHQGWDPTSCRYKGQF